MRKSSFVDLEGVVGWEKVAVAVGGGIVGVILVLLFWPVLITYKIVCQLYGQEE